MLDGVRHGLAHGQLELVDAGGVEAVLLCGPFGEIARLLQARQVRRDGVLAALEASHARGVLRESV
jgi:hypothetical protein